MRNNCKYLILNDKFKRQRGQALLALLAILAIGFGAAFYAFISPANSAIERDKITAAALAQAKEALIGYAVGVSNLAGGDRPGDLPCPDLNDSGSPGASWTSNCDAQTLRIGRLPWKTLGLPDLRDSSGERLWYAVSINFKDDTRTACTVPGNAGCLNSDARGTITLRNSAGAVIHDGANPDPFTPSGIIAVIFAPGAVLQRQDGVQQIRDCSGAGCIVASGVCNGAATAKCNPINYLDVLNGIEDNANFTDGSPTDGFINGMIRDASGNVIVNDRLITITYNDLMPALQRRVAKEALNCLTTYASITQNSGRYPWAAPITNITLPYADAVDTRFGRIPDTLSATQLGTSGGVADLSCPTTTPSTVCMSANWPAGCGIIQGNWWTNWKELVFYGVADAYKPADPVFAGGVPASTGCGSCLTVNPPSAVADKRVVVAVAGNRLSSAAYGAGNNQPRFTPADKQNPTNYLEGTNNNTATSNTYEQQPISASFSDFLLYQ